MRSDYLNSVSKNQVTPSIAARVNPEAVLQQATVGLPVTVADIMQSPLFDECDLRLIASGELTATDLYGYVAGWLKNGRQFPFPLP